MMTTKASNGPEPQGQKLPLSEWDNEGGAGRCGPKESTAGLPAPEIPELTNTELVQLRVRVIALENLVTALLAGAPERQHDLARSMAEQISPRRGTTPHPLTIQAASHMNGLVERAIHYRDAPTE